MRRVGIWFFLSCKRYLHRLSFLCILLFLPVGAYLIRDLEKTEKSEIRIAVCVDGAGQSVTGQGVTGRNETGQNDTLEQNVIRGLVSRETEDGLFRFYLCDDEEQVKADVASRKAECGYVFPTGLREKLNEKSYKRSIRVYSAPSTVAAGLSSEVVFAELISHYDRELFQDYLASGEIFAGVSEAGEISGAGSASEAKDRSDPAYFEELLETGGARYDAWMKDGGTFHFVYGQGAAQSGLPGGQKEAQSGQTDGQEKKDAVRLFPVRGIVAVYVFVIALYGAAIMLKDEKRGLYLPLPSNGRFPCQIVSVLAPAALAAMSGYAALASGAALAGPVREGVLIAAYTVASSAFSWLLARLCKKEAVIVSLIPFFLVGSLIFCPVMIDIGRYIPALASVGKYFLPWHYLKFF